MAQPSPLSPAFCGIGHLLSLGVGHAFAVGEVDALVIVVDDAQLLDGLSATLVYRLAADRAVGLILTLRSGVEVSDAVATLLKENWLADIAVDPFTKKQTAELAHVVLADDVESRLVDELYQRTAGNPLLLRGFLGVRRGDVWYVDFDPVLGSDADQRRPAVIVSNDRANDTAARLGRGVVTVVPVTSNTATVYSFQVLLTSVTTGLPVDSKAQAEQIRSVATQRLRERIGRVSSAELTTLDDALRLHLQL